MSLRSALLATKPTTTPPPAGGLIPGAALLLEADAGIVATGSNIQEWQDQSGNGNHLFDVGGTDPQVGVAPSGAPSIEFDGVAALFRPHSSNPLVGIPGGNTSRTIFFVVEYTATPAASTGAGAIYGRGATNRACGLVNAGGTGFSKVKLWGGGDVITTTLVNGAGWVIQSLTHDEFGDSNGRWEHFLDNVSLHVGANDSLNTSVDESGSQIVVASDIDLDPEDTMNVGAYIIYDRVLTPAEMSQMDIYLRAKYITP